jgi:hypothetical protein
MVDDARKQKALKLADQAARREAHEDGAFAAEVVRREHGDDFEGARDPAQRAYDAAWIAAYAECREDFEALMLALLNAYDGEKHPASVTAAMLADAVLVERDPEHKAHPDIVAGARRTLIQLAEKILETFPAAHEPN